MAVARSLRWRVQQAGVLLMVCWFWRGRADAQTVDLSLSPINPPPSPTVGEPAGFQFSIGGLAGANGVTLTVIFQPPVSLDGPGSCTANVGTDSTTVTCFPITTSPLTVTVRPQSSGTLNVVAGVIATEYDVNMANNSAPPLAVTVTGASAPTGLVATQTSEAQITVTWTAPPGGADFYEVWRAPGVGSSYVLLSPNPTSPSFVDSGAAQGGTYLYQVCASRGGVCSGYSNADPATRFTDYQIIQYSTTMKASHINELRTAIDVRRGLVPLPPGGWSPAVAPGVLIRRGEVQQLRDLLDDAMGEGTYTEDPLPANPPGTTIKKQHIQELRNRVQ